MHLLICLGEDKYLLTLPGFFLICPNSAQCHHLELTARALPAQPEVLNLSARCDWRPASLHAVSRTPKSFRAREPRDKCRTPRKGERRGCPRRWRRGVPWPPGSVGPSRWGAEQSSTSQKCGFGGLDYPGTFAPAQPYSRWHEQVEKPGTETTSELSCEPHVTQKPQLTICEPIHIISICFNTYNFSHGSFYSAFITIFPCLSYSISTNILLAELLLSTQRKQGTYLGPKSTPRCLSQNHLPGSAQQWPQGCQNPKNTKAHTRIWCSVPT